MVSDLRNFNLKYDFNFPSFQKRNVVNANQRIRLIVIILFKTDSDKEQ